MNTIDMMACHFFLSPKVINHFQILLKKQPVSVTYMVLSQNYLRRKIKSDMIRKINYLFEYCLHQVKQTVGHFLVVTTSVREDCSSQSSHRLFSWFVETIMWKKSLTHYPHADECHCWHSFWSRSPESLGVSWKPAALQNCQ